MLKLNVTRSDGSRLIVIGLSGADITMLRDDRPIAFPGAHMGLTIPMISLVYVKNIGHFLTTVSPALGLSPRMTQNFIDGYRKTIKQRTVRHWYPWAVGDGSLRGMATGKVACGLLTEELLSAMEQGDVSESEAFVLDMAPTDRLITYVAPTAQSLGQGLLGYLEGRDDIELAVIKGVHEFLDGELGSDPG